MTAIETCRTAVLGGHVEACNACGHQRIAYHSCANRHCPKCQSLRRAAWIDARTKDLLDVEYFHVVFTVPQDVAALGFFALLHTWGQTLVAHPHLHCVIPGGGLSPDGTQWVPYRPGFFLPVRVLSRLFRRLFLQHLQAAYDA